MLTKSQKSKEPKEQRSQPDRTRECSSLSLSPVASVGRTFAVTVEFTIQFLALSDSLHAETAIRGLLINLI